MKRFLRANVTLAAFAFLGFGILPTQADVHLSEHQAFYAFDVFNSQVKYDAYDTVTADASGDSARETVSLLGDPATFAWDAAGTFPGTSVAVSDVTAGSGSASATLTVSGPATLVGSSHYGYLSNVGDGLLTDPASTLDFHINPSDLKYGDLINIALPGAWTAGQASPGSGLDFSLDGSNQITNLFLSRYLNITSDFIYDSTLDATLFSAQAVPEPSVNVLLASLLFSGAGLIQRRLRRQR